MQRKSKWDSVYINQPVLHNKIMIIEDDPIVALDLQERLYEMGCHVIGIAFDERGAIELMQHSQVDILLCDIDLKHRVSGIEIVRKIRQSYNPAVIYLTGMEDVQTMQNAIDTAPAGYLTKPYRYNELYALVTLTMRQCSNVNCTDETNILVLNDGYFFDRKKGTLQKEGAIVCLTKKERELLRYLATRLNKIASFEELTYTIWSHKSVVESNRRMLIHRLHSKIGKSIITVVKGNRCFLNAYPPKFFLS